MLGRTDIGDLSTLKESKKVGACPRDWQSVTNRVSSAVGTFMLMLSNAPVDYLLNRRIALLDHGRLPKSSANCQWCQVPTSRRPNFILGVAVSSNL